MHEYIVDQEWPLIHQILELPHFHTQILFHLLRVRLILIFIGFCKALHHGGHQTLDEFGNPGWLTHLQLQPRMLFWHNQIHLLDPIGRKTRQETTHLVLIHLRPS